MPKIARVHIKVMGSEELLKVAAHAICHTTIREKRPVSLRITVFEGLRLLNEDRPLRFLIQHKFFKRSRFSGSIGLFLPMTREEYDFLKSLRDLLQTESDNKLTNSDVIVMALLAIPAIVADGA